MPLSMPLPSGTHISASRGGRRARRRALGQHFLRDATIAEAIIQALAPLPGEHILEIGPGRGALSIPLCRYPIRLSGVERDRALIAALRRRAPDMILYQGNILDFDLRALAGPGPGLRVLGNLPYSIGTEVLFRLLRYRELIKDVLVLLQKEVVQRITAPPGASGRGRLSVMCQTWYETQALFDVPAGAFRPAPRVVSTLLSLRPSTRWSRCITDQARYAELLRRVFSMRRKTLRNSLRGAQPLLEQLGIDPRARPESLSVGDFIALSQATLRQH